MQGFLFHTRRSRVPYYLCCCLALGCFITLSLIIAVSFNSNLLSENSIGNNLDKRSFASIDQMLITGTVNNIPTMVSEQFLITMDIIDHLNHFADQVNTN